MDADYQQAPKLKRGDRTFAIIGAAMEVLNELGHGLHEKPYENALVVEFQQSRIPYVQQPEYDIQYKGVRVGQFKPDLIVFDTIIVDTKVVEKITAQEQGQMINYLKVTGLDVGLILNFHKPKLEWKRIVR